MTHNIYIYLLIMAAICLVLRSAPMLFFKGEVKNPLLQSFFYYVPYTTLALMTFPDIIHTTDSPLAGIGACILGIVLAWRGAGLLRVVAACSVAVIVLGFVF